jgi:uncharacterized membrane protein
VESRARILGHSLHQILIVFPLGLLVTGAGFDVLGALTADARWPATSYYITIVGLLGGVAAAVFGLIDYLAIPHGTRAKRIGLWHGLSSVALVGLFAISEWLRTPNPSVVHRGALVLSLIAVALAGLAGWLGGELVNRMGVGVADDANLDAGRRSTAMPPVPGGSAPLHRAVGRHVG